MEKMLLLLLLLLGVSGVEEDAAAAAALFSFPSSSLLDVLSSTKFDAEMSVRFLFDSLNLLKPFSVTHVEWSLSF